MESLWITVNDLDPRKDHPTKAQQRWVSGGFRECHFTTRGGPVFRLISLRAGIG
jgi:hypothetical protein